MNAGGSWTPYAGARVGPGLEPDKEFGVLWLSYSGGLVATVERADPRARLSGQLVREALGANPQPGQRVVICGADRRVVYVIGAHHDPVDPSFGDWYEAEWPD